MDRRGRSRRPAGLASGCVAHRPARAGTTVHVHAAVTPADAAHPPEAGYPFCLSKHTAALGHRPLRRLLRGRRHGARRPGPCPHEGTFGWDYTGSGPLAAGPAQLDPRSPYQGGEGRYATDGPKPLERHHEAVHEISGED